MKTRSISSLQLRPSPSTTPLELFALKCLIWKGSCACAC